MVQSGEGNGNPLWYSCLENPVDRGTWWAAFYGVAQSQTRLMCLSSSSNMVYKFFINKAIIYVHKYILYIYKR